MKPLCSVGNLEKFRWDFGMVVSVPFFGAMRSSKEMEKASQRWASRRRNRQKG
jgi:hypothetical protein